MTASRWDLLYGRPPLSRDALLFGVALALHLPLFLMQFKGIVRSKGSNPSFVEIETREEAIERILQRGMVLPPPPPVVAPPRLNLSGLIKNHSVLPVLPPPSKGLPAVVNNPVPSLKANVPSPVISSEGTMISKGDRGKFAVAQGTIETIDPGGALALGKSKAISIPTAPTARAESGIKSPTPLTPKILLAPLPSEGPVAPKSALKVDRHAGTKIEVMAEPAETEGEGMPIVRPQPRALTPEQRRNELFPIHGALKDRAVDRQEIPEYPDWARKQGIESSVQFRFSVTADGRVKETIAIVKGSGYPELDELARRALLRWIFSALPPEKGNLVQDGIIEFRFSLK